MQKHEPTCAFEQPPNVLYIGGNKYRLDEPPGWWWRVRCTCNVAPGKTLHECMQEIHDFYILIVPWTVYVKEAKFFESQGGLTSAWGQSWERVQATSIEDAWRIGEERRTHGTGRMAENRGGEHRSPPHQK